MRYVAVPLALLALTAMACSDNPAAPADTGPGPVDSAPPAPAALVSTPPCTKRWKSGVSGDWSVGSNWTPSGVPDSLAVVCLDAAGSYTVTWSNPAKASYLVVGGSGASPTLTVSATTRLATWDVTNGLHVKSGATVTMTTALSLGAKWLVNEGSLLASFPGRRGFATADSVVNLGYLETVRDTLVVTTSRYFRNAGTLQLTGPAAQLPVYTPSGGTFLMQGGTVLGQGEVVFWPILPSLPAPTFYIVPSFDWSGGTLPPRLGTTEARVRVQGVHIRLLDSTLSGTLELDVYQLSSFYHPYDVALITGPDKSVPAGVRLNVGGAGAVIVPGMIRGTLSLTPLDTAATDTVGVIFTGTGLGGVEVSGSLLLNAGTGALALVLDSLLNSGTVVVDAPAGFPALQAIRNQGTITVGSSTDLALTRADFVAESGSVQTGWLRMTGGKLSGTGLAGDVISVGATIAPGPVGRVGTLSAVSLVLDSGSTVNLHIAGLAPGMHDELLVKGQVYYRGTLRLLPVSTSIGGKCGQELTLIQDNSPFSLLRGAFDSIEGLSLSATRAWRVANPAWVYALEGYDPSVPVSVEPTALTVAEGGAAAAYDVCLRDAPTATVTVTPAAAGGQLAALSPVSFTPSSWEAYATVAVSAVDDALVEPPPQLATITHTVTSTDPAYGGVVPAPVTVTILDNDGSTNLELHVLNTPPVVAVGGSFTLDLQNENLGPDASVGATFTIPASAGFVYASSAGTLGCSYDAVTGTTCQLPSLASGAHTDFSVTLTAVAAGSYSTSYSVSTIQSDPNLLNNTRNQLVTIN